MSEATGLADLLALLAGREAERVNADLREQLAELTTTVGRLQGRLLLLEARNELGDDSEALTAWGGHVFAEPRA